MMQCSSCGGFCGRVCQRANATICKHFRLGLVTGFEKSCIYCENDNLHQRIAEVERVRRETVEEAVSAIQSLWHADDDSSRKCVAAIRGLLK